MSSPHDHVAQHKKHSFCDLSRGVDWYFVQDSVCTGIWCHQSGHVFTSQTCRQPKAWNARQWDVHASAGLVEELR